MKRLLPILLLTAAQNTAYADVRLDFKSYVSDKKTQSLSYLVKNNRLRLDNGNEHRFNLFDNQKQEFISASLRTGNISRINESILAQRVSQLNKKRLNRLSKIIEKVDKKRSSMSEKELEVREALITQLKYPDQYGAHSFNKIEPLNTTKVIAGIECQQYAIKQKNKRLKEVCISTKKQLGISEQDFEILRNYEEFNYQVESRIMLAAGETDFDLISLKENNIKGIVIERANFSKNKVTQRLSLVKLSTVKLKESQLLIPKIE